MFLLYFLKTNNFSGYIMTRVITEAIYNHHFSARSLNIILLHTLKHLLHFTHPFLTYAQTSFRNSLSQNDVPKSVRSNVHITSFSCISCIPNSFTLSLKHLTTYVQTISLTANPVIITCTLARIFTFFSESVC